MAPRVNDEQAEIHARRQLQKLTIFPNQRGHNYAFTLAECGLQTCAIVSKRTAALSSFSAFSSVATESRTIAPPAPTLILSPALTMERITIFKSAVPSKPRYPIAPEYTPRGPASRASMMLSVRSLGAPVIEPPG